MANGEWQMWCFGKTNLNEALDARVARNGQCIVIVTEPDGTSWQSLAFDVEAPGVPATAWEAVEVST